MAWRWGRRPRAAFWLQQESEALGQPCASCHTSPFGPSVFSALLTRCPLLLWSTETGLPATPRPQARSPPLVCRKPSHAQVPLQILQHLTPDDSSSWGLLSLPHVGIFRQFLPSQTPSLQLGYSSNSHNSQSLAMSRLWDLNKLYLGLSQPLSLSLRVILVLAWI